MKRFKIITLAMAALLCTGRLLLGHSLPKTTPVHTERIPMPAIPYQETTVPLLVSRHHELYIRATVGDRRVKCLVDTGTALTEWPQSLSFGGTFLDKDYDFENFDYMNRANLGRMKIIPDIKVGTYPLYRTLTAAMTHPYPDPRLQTGNVLTLGNSTLSGTVMTLDYRARTLTLRSYQYDPGVKVLPGSFLIPFHWVQRSRYDPGLPAVFAQVNGHPTQMVLDTGSYGIALTSCFGKRSLPPHTFVPSASPQFVHCTTFVTVAHVTFRSGQVLLLPNLRVGADGLLGSAILRTARMTIDYPRKQILLEPYDKQVLP